jgi:hypothetical protein
MVIIAIDKLMPSTDNVNCEFSIGIQAYNSEALPLLRIVGTVVKIKPRMASATADSSKAAYFADFLPARYMKGTAKTGKSKTVNRIGYVMFRDLAHL